MMVSVGQFLRASLVCTIPGLLACCSGGIHHNIGTCYQTGLLRLPKSVVSR
jgi:hypothetical protein